jgi:hypothetical protein
VTHDLAANQTENRFGFGWNTAGRLSVQNGGKSFGVKGSGGGMPGTTQAAAYDQYDTGPGKRKSLVVTIGTTGAAGNGVASGVSLQNDATFEFGSYDWKQYNW